MLSSIFEIVFALVFLFVFCMLLTYAFYKGPSVLSVICSIILLIILYTIRHRLDNLGISKTDSMLAVLAFSVLVVSNFAGASIHRINTGAKVVDPLTIKEVNQVSYSPVEVNEMLASKENRQLTQLIKYAMLRHVLVQKLNSKKKRDIYLRNDYLDEIRTLDKYLFDTAEFFANDVKKRIK